MNNQCSGSSQVALIHPTNLPVKRPRLLFKHKALLNLFIGLILTSLAVGMLIWPMYDGIPWLIAGFSVLFLVLIAFIALQMYFRCLKDSNWLIRCEPEHLLINLKSYLNSHIVTDFPHILKVNYKEIVSAQQQIEIVYTKSASNSRRKEKLVWLEFIIDHDLQPVKTCLADIKSVKVSWRYNPTQFKVGQNSLKVLFNGITPKGDTLLKHLAFKGVVISKEASPSEKDFIDPDNLDEAILELSNSGRTIDSLLLARRGYGLSVTEAKQYIESLRVDTKSSLN